MFPFSRRLPQILLKKSFVYEKLAEMWPKDRKHFDNFHIKKIKMAQVCAW